jgi:hypothetical protein
MERNMADQSKPGAGKTGHEPASQDRGPSGDSPKPHGDKLENAVRSAAEDPRKKH